jgi:hypothetical protein
MPVPVKVDPAWGVLDALAQVSVVVEIVPVQVASVVAKAANDRPPPSEHPELEVPSPPVEAILKSHVVLSLARRRLMALFVPVA